MCDSALDRQSLDGRGRRDAVQRHIDDCRDATCHGSTGRTREPLPLGTPWLVDVHVRVDDAGQQHFVFGERDERPVEWGNDLSVGRAVEVAVEVAFERAIGDLRDAPVPHANPCRPEGAINEGRVSMNDEVE